MPRDLTLNREQSRRVDELAVERYGMAGLVLMENAGRATEIIADLYRQLPSPTGKVVICYGKGNNGGDGFVIARHLDNVAIPVSLALFCDPLSLTGDAATNYDIVRRAMLPMEIFSGEFKSERLAPILQKASILVDALLGTGAKGEPRPPLDRVIDAINSQSKLVVAIDVPSGLDCDAGTAAKHTIRAAHTITFVAKKPGFLKPEAEPYVGTLHVVDIGVPRKLLDELVVR